MSRLVSFLLMCFSLHAAYASEVSKLGYRSCSAFNNFETETLVHTRILTDTGYQNKLKRIADIEVGDEVLAWDELQAHDNAQTAKSGVNWGQIPIKIAEMARLARFTLPGYPHHIIQRGNKGQIPIKSITYSASK